MYRYIILPLTLIIILGLFSCKKSFLDIVPKGKLIASTYDDYNLLMNNPQFYLFGNRGVWQAAMIMGDEVAAEANYFNATTTPAPSRALFRWDDDVFLPSTSPTTANPLFLTALLENVYAANKIITEVMDVPAASEQQKRALRAEAKCARAFAYFQLINYFGKPYSLSTAQSDPGFPIITSTNITDNNFTRNSVQQVYDFIVGELSESIPDLPIQQPIATRMCRAGAEGILGKVYLFTNRNSEALAMFDSAFADIARMSAPPKLYNYNQTFAPGGAFLPISATTGPNSPYNNATDLTESVVATISYGGTRVGNSNGYGNDYLTVKSSTVNLFDPADWRLSFYSGIQQDKTPIPGGRLRKYGVKYVRIGMQLSDLYLLRAEARARANDLSGAKSDLEELRRNRLPQANASVPTAALSAQAPLIRFIIEERIREFASEGYRWFDMRRLYSDPIFVGSSPGEHILYNAAGTVSTHVLRPERLTLRLPQFYLNSNPGMINNP